MTAIFAKLKDHRGFSLIELMVVISIISALATFAFPRFQAFKIKAARAEAFVNIKAFATAAHAHHAEHGLYNPSGGVVGFGVLKYFPNLRATYCVVTGVGFKATNCEKLRYFYAFTTSNASTNFSIQAKSYLSMSGSTLSFQYGGGGPPINISTCPGGGGLHVFDDELHLDHNGVLVQFTDALDLCT